MIEITYHPISIEYDLAIFFDWIKQETDVSIQDEDGELWEY